MVARWQINARFGHKQTVIDLLRKWEREVGTPRPQPDKMQGTDRLDRARVEADHAVKGIAQLEEFFAVLGDNANGDPNPMWFRVPQCGTFIGSYDSNRRSAEGP